MKRETIRQIVQFIITILTALLTTLTTQCFMGGESTEEIYTSRGRR